MQIRDFKFYYILITCLISLGWCHRQTFSNPNRVDGPDHSDNLLLLLLRTSPFPPTKTFGLHQQPEKEDHGSRMRILRQKQVSLLQTPKTQIRRVLQHFLSFRSQSQVGGVQETGWWFFVLWPISKLESKLLWQSWLFQAQIWVQRYVGTLCTLIKKYIYSSCFLLI